MSLFGNIFAPKAPVQTPAAPASGATPPAGATTPTGAPAATDTPPVVASPMDNFVSLWEPTATPEVDRTLPANMFSGVDPTKMLEAARKVDFAKSISPEILAKITAGGPEAAAAFAAALNDVGQQSYAQSSFAATKIVESALKQFNEGLDNRLPQAIKNQTVSESIRQSNPALAHPAAAPILNALQAQFSVKYPNASAAELQEMASKYLSGFAELASPKAPAPKPNKSEDWETFFQ